MKTFARQLTTQFLSPTHFNDQEINEVKYELIDSKKQHSEVTIHELGSTWNSHHVRQAGRYLQRIVTKWAQPNYWPSCVTACCSTKTVSNLPIRPSPRACVNESLTTKKLSKLCVTNHKASRKICRFLCGTKQKLHEKSNTGTIGTYNKKTLVK